MSGLAGILRFDGAPVEAGLVEKMTAAMAHRGPDGIRHWRRGPVALGQCMLRTTPESFEETQPLANEDESLVLVMDGRLDNWVELRAELLARGTTLRNRSDAELVLRAYEAWGRECLGHLDGDFALVLWDARRQQAFCARDRMGHKPFNYRWDGATLVFASELHAILALPGVSPALNEGLLTDYLTLDWRASDETPWRGIHRLLQARWLEAGAGGLQSGRYWHPEADRILLYDREEQYAEHYLAVLADAVRRASRSHAPLACEVSGGLDSSAVFALAAQQLRQARPPAPALAGFTLRFDDASEADELAYARAVAAHCGVPVREVEPSHPPLAWYGDWAQRYREFPGYPNGIMAWGIREHARSAGCRALLTGAGGDEWLSGSRDYYAEELSAGRVGAFLQCFQADRRAAGTGSALRWMARSFAGAYLPPALRDALRRLRAQGRAPDADDDPGEWLSPRLKAIAGTRRGAPAVRRASLARAGQAPLYRALDAGYDLLARESEERLAASLGVELRRPLYSRALVQFAFSTPARLWMRGGTTKVLHRRALAGLLPEAVLARESKADFMVAFRRYGDGLRTASSPQAAAQVGDWVRGPRLAARLAAFGDRAHRGVPEWTVWGWFGWRLLAAGPAVLQNAS